MARSRVELSRQAEREYQAITHYLGQVQGTLTPREFRSRFRRLLANLRQFPSMGKPRPDLNPNARQVPYLSWYVLYTDEPGLVTIYRIRHQRQDDTNPLLIADDTATGGQ